MKYFLFFLLIAIITGLILGHFIQKEDVETGNLIIGLSISMLFFVLMPLFIYYRWKGKDLKKYMLTKENIEKMRDYSDEKKL